MDENSDAKNGNRHLVGRAHPRPRPHALCSRNLELLQRRQRHVLRFAAGLRTLPSGATTSLSPRQSWRLRCVGDGFGRGTRRERRFSRLTQRGQNPLLGAAESAKSVEGLYPNHGSRGNLRIAWRRLRRADGRSPLR